MRVILTDPFIDELVVAPPQIQKLFGKQLSLLLRNFRHKSLRAKRFDNERFQARINDDWRFYYRIDSDTYVLLTLNYETHLCHCEHSEAISFQTA